MQGIIS